MTGFQRRLDARLVLSIVAIGVMSFAGVVVETAMNIAFPALMTEFGVSTARVQWITTGYLLVLAAIMPISSLLNRRFRTRSLFLTAMALFVAGTVLCAAAPRFDLLIGGRLIQGVGTGILLPFLLAALLLGALTIREAHEPERVPFAPAQFAALAAGFTCFVLAMNAASTAGFASARVLVLIGCAAALVGAFCALSRRSHAPLLRIGVFADRTFTLSILYVVLVQGIVLALGYLIPYYAQVGAGAGSFAAGCLLLPGCVVGACLTPFGGRILDRLGPARPIVTGAVFGAAAMALFALLGVRGGTARLAWIYLLVPVCQGLSISNSMTHALRGLPDDLQADGNAAFNTVQQLGGAIGTAVATAIVNAAQAADPADPVAATTAGTRQVFWLLLGVMIVAGLLAGAAVLPKTPAADPPVPAAPVQ